MSLATAMLVEVMRIREIFGALDTVEGTEAGEILRRLRVFVLSKVFWRFQVGLDLVEVTGMGSAAGVFRS
jgi:hypothetical protein